MPARASGRTLVGGRASERCAAGKRPLGRDDLVPAGRMASAVGRDTVKGEGRGKMQGLATLVRQASWSPTHPASSSPTTVRERCSGTVQALMSVCCWPSGTRCSGPRSNGCPRVNVACCSHWRPTHPSYEQVGAALSIPVGTIGPTRQRALRRLRMLLNEAEKMQSATVDTVALSVTR
jgi:hypothetical protein